jgi:hypothetical protein
VSEAFLFPALTLPIAVLWFIFVVRLVRFPTLKQAVTDEIFVVLLSPTMLKNSRNFLSVSTTVFTV